MFFFFVVSNPNLFRDRLSISFFSFFSGRTYWPFIGFLSEQFYDTWGNFYLKIHFATMLPYINSNLENSTKKQTHYCQFFRNIPTYRFSCSSMHKLEISYILGLPGNELGTNTSKKLFISTTSRLCFSFVLSVENRCFNE